MKTTTTYFPTLENVQTAREKLASVISPTPLMQNINRSEKHAANIWLKREDLQVVRSYKIRGAYNKMSSYNSAQLKNGVVCASAGNHAQGVAFSCRKLEVKGKVYMPNTTPGQKVKQVKMFGKEWVDIVLTGDTFDDAFAKAMEDATLNNSTFIHPFDDPKVIEGQGTVALEVLEQADEKIDYLFVPIGGGGLASGVGSIFKLLSPKTKIIGVEPEGAPAMKTSFENGKNTALQTIDKFVDGAAVKKVGDLTFNICKDVVDEIVTVPEGKVCSTILQLYNEDAIVAEPAGALTIAALDLFEEEIKGKNVVCIVSGSNNDISRTAEIKERALLYEEMKHYFIVRFPQRAGALKEFVAEVLGPNDDITHFEYSKKHHREKGPALIGIELKNREDYDPLVGRMQQHGFDAEYLNEKPDLFQYLV
jgi:threonine dehydratase